jgi:hypothetical protein
MALTRQEEARDLKTRRVHRGLTNRGYDIKPISGSIRDGDQTFRVTGPGGNSEILTLDEADSLCGYLAIAQVEAQMTRMTRWAACMTRRSSNKGVPGRTGFGLLFRDRSTKPCLAALGSQIGRKPRTECRKRGPGAGFSGEIFRARDVFKVTGAFRGTQS